MAELFKNIKHLCHYMDSGKIRLSRQDQKFITSLNNLFQISGQVTSNQVDLFNLILRKYDRQFSNLGFDVNKLMALPWPTTIVESSKKYTDAYLSLVDGEIIFRAPYNTKFLKHLRDHPHSEFFSWHKIKRQFEATYNTITLKLIIDLAFKHYKFVHCCPIVIKLMDDLVQYDNIKYWAPTLVKVNNHYLIASTNPIIDNLVSNIELNESPYVLNYLCKHAINVDESIPDTAEKLFASLYNPIVDYSDCDELVSWLHQIKCDSIYLESKHKVNKNWETLKKTMYDTGIPVYEMTPWRKTPQPKEKGFTNSVLIKGLADSHNIEELSPIAKVISMVNNNSINIK
jgi:hypothetical protein